MLSVAEDDENSDLQYSSAAFLYGTHMIDTVALGKRTS